MVIRMRHTKSKRNRVRSHHALKKKQLTKCTHCLQPAIPHTLCQNCGYYAGRQIIDVLAKLDKKERKKKEKELHEHETEAAEEGKTLNAEELSHK
jgi:large subunit ribosomal protein L32